MDIVSERIAYVCLSDLHLGDADSVLTQVAPTPEGRPQPSAALQQLVVCLRTLAASQQGPPPTLILNGDVLELAFGPMHHALGVFEHFLARLTEPGREAVGKIVYVPGNHDHHIWELARETRYARDLATSHTADGPPPVRHATGLGFDAAVSGSLLDLLLDHVRNGGAHDTAAASSTVGRGLRIAYPNFALHDPTRRRAVLFHHGHFVEELYRLFSRARALLVPGSPPAATVEQIETENFAWIEFVWSLLGRSGEAGEDVETIFEMLRYPARVKAYTADLARRVAPRIRMPFLPFAWMRCFVIRHVLRRLLARIDVERLDSDDVCSVVGMRGIQAYLFGPALRQMQDEFGTTPDEMTFVFGHTHKPFEKSMHDPAGRPVSILNTGGWTIETAKANTTYGASVVLVSEDLETVSLRVFQDGDDLAAASADPEEALPALRAAPDAAPSAFREAVSKAVTGEHAAAWQSLARCIAEEAVLKRARHVQRYGGATS